VGQPILAADTLSSVSSRLKAGCGQDCPPHIGTLDCKYPRPESCIDAFPSGPGYFLFLHSIGPTPVAILPSRRRSAPFGRDRDRYRFARQPDRGGRYAIVRSSRSQGLSSAPPAHTDRGLYRLDRFLREPLQPPGGQRAIHRGGPRELRGALRYRALGDLQEQRYGGYLAQRPQPRREKLRHRSAAHLAPLRGRVRPLRKSDYGGDTCTPSTRCPPQAAPARS